MKRRTLAWALSLAGTGALLTWVIVVRLEPWPSRSNVTARVAIDPQLRDGHVGYGAADSAATGYLMQVSQVTGITFKYVRTVSREDSFHRLAAGSVDIVPSLLDVPQPVAAQQVQYSAPYYQGATLIITRSKAAKASRSLAMLSGKTVAFKRGGEYELWLQQHRPDIQRLPLPEVSDVLAAVEAGIADAALGVDALYSPLIRRDYQQSLQVAGTASELPVAIRLIVRRDDAVLLETINAGIRHISPAQHAQVLARWMDAVYHPAPTLRALFRHYAVELALGAAALLALMFALYQMRRLHRLAKTSEREKARLLAVMSHEIRNSANALVAAVDLMAQGNILPEQRDLLTAARASGTSLRALLDNALEYSRLEAGRSPLHNSRCDVVAIAQECILAFQPLANEKGLRCLLRVPHGLLPWLWLDAVCLRQLVINLLSNAIKFTEKGEVSLSVWFKETSDESGWLHVQVEDTGIGMPKTAQEALFQPFSQLPGSRSQGGAGLGLSICQAIVEKMQGQLRLHSAPGQGSRFEIDLPTRVAVANDLDVTPDQTPLTSDTPASTTVLVVEDHPYSRRTLVSQVEALGFSAIASVDGKTALDAIQQHGPLRAALLDCNLPDIDGYEVARTVRAIETQKGWPPMKLVAISALSGEAHTQACILAGIDRILCKPIAQHQIADCLEVQFRATEAPSLHQLFIGSLQQDLSALEVAVASGQGEEAIYRAHRIHGSALMANEKEIASISREVEQLWEAALSGEDQTPAAATEPLMDRLRVLADRVH